MSSANLREQFKRKCAQSRAQLLAAAATPEASQAKLLKTFIERNAETEFGKEHRFASIRTVDDFRRAVPIRDYAALKPWLERAVQGEPSILTQEPPAMFFRTAGTTGTPKALPATHTAMGTTRGPAMYALWGNFLEYHPELVEHEYATLDIHWDRRPSMETVGADNTPIQSMAQREGLMHPDDFSPPWYDASWFTPQLDIPSYAERMYKKIICFAQKKVRAVTSINPITMHIFAETLAKNTDRLLKDLRAQNENTELVKRLDLAARARGGYLLPVDLWPTISFIGCRKSATAALYVPRLYQLFGKHISICPYSTAGAEGSQAIPVNQHSTAGVAALRSSFMEFLPISSAWQPDSPTRLVHELEHGSEYQTVLTTPDGLYRYAIGDVFKVLDFEGPTPLLEYQGRVGRTSSMVDEQLSEQQIVDAGLAVAAHFGIELSLFTCCPQRQPCPRYSVILESASVHVPPAEQLATALEEELMASNSHYRNARSANKLSALVVKLIQPGTFYTHWFRSVNKDGKTIQLQIQPLQDDDALLYTFAHCDNLSQ